MEMLLVCTATSRVVARCVSAPALLQSVPELTITLQPAHSPPAEPINDATNKTCEQACIGWADLLGCNNKSSGGFVGMASEVSFVNEFQFSGTTHGHGLSPHAGMFQVQSSMRR